MRPVAGEVLTGQTRQIVEHWRSGIIAGISHLARHSRTLGDAIAFAAVMNETIKPFLEAKKNPVGPYAESQQAEP